MTLPLAARAGPPDRRTAGPPPSSSIDASDAISAASAIARVNAGAATAITVNTPLTPSPEPPAIVKHVTAAHGGNVSVWSREGEGSTFTLRLPLRPRRGLSASGKDLGGQDQSAVRTNRAGARSVREAVK